MTNTSQDPTERVQQEKEEAKKGDDFEVQSSLLSLDQEGTEVEFTD